MTVEHKQYLENELSYKLLKTPSDRLEAQPEETPTKSQAFHSDSNIVPWWPASVTTLKPGATVQYNYKLFVIFLHENG